MPNNNKRDYGFYGKGNTGYQNYKRDFDRNYGHSSGGNNLGCLGSFIELFLIGIFIIVGLAIGIPMVFGPVYLLNLLFD